MSTNQKVAVVTGASQGIGAGIVQGFLDHGYQVVANSRSIKPIKTSNLVAVAGDITDPAVADRLIKGAVDHFGRVDTLVNNAGMFIAKPFTDYTTADLTNMLTLNLQGFFYISQQAIAQMLKQQDGHVVNITTTLVGQPVKGVPSALASLTKGGLDAVTRSLAIEYADQGIRVNAVAPGAINTPMHAKENHSFLSKLHPIERMGEVSEIVEAVMYLESAKFVTGETLHVDGGAHAGHW